MSRAADTADPRPRLLCLMQLPPPVHGGSVMNEQIARSPRLAARFALDVLPLRFAESIEDIGRLSPRKVVRTVTTALRLTGALLFARPDAVYFTLSPVGAAFYRDCVFIAIMKALHVPRIYHLHGKGIAGRLRTPWQRATYGWAFRGARVIHLSPLLATDVAAVVNSRALLYVANGVPDGGGATEGDEWRSAVPRVLYLSNMIEEKGPLVLLQALVELNARGVAFEATFAGARFDTATSGAFESALDRSGLRDRVSYVGPVYGAAKAELFRTHDVFVLPTHYAQEAFPLVLLEAMSRALPVIATPEGAIPEIVADGATGFLVPRRDPHALAARLERLLSDESLRRRMGAAGRERFLERFTLDHFERSLSEALKQFLRDSGAAGRRGRRSRPVLATNPSRSNASR